MTELKRKLTLYGLTMVAVGSCIGAGIFVTPYEVVKSVPHHGFILFVWALGGLITMTGALTFAELGGMYPKAGGVYVFLKEAYGDLIGFLYGWVILLVINTGALAALGLAFAEYTTFFFPLTASAKTILAIGLIILLTGINILGVQTSQWLATVFTGLKLLAMIAIVAVAFIYFDAEKVNLSFNFSENAPSSLGSALLVALIGVLWSFGGWHHASYLASETINPQKNVPKAMIFGALIVTAIYVLINLAYLMLLPLDAIKQSIRVAGDAVASVITNGGKLVALAIGISIFGTISIYTMSAPRIYFAMASDGIFFRQLAKIHPKYSTPANAMIAQAFWAILLLLFWGTFHDLITYVTFIDIGFMTLAATTIFWFRKKEKDRPRPYFCWGYPVIPAIFIITAGAFVINTLIERPVQALAGLILLGLGIFAFFGFKKQA